MKILFEDGALLVADADYNYKINTKSGPSFCVARLKFLLRVAPQFTVYTNYLGALCFDYSWDRENNKCNAYIRSPEDHMTWVNIQDLTNRELRFAHNIPKMYMAGEFC